MREPPRLRRSTVAASVVALAASFGVLGMLAGHSVTYHLLAAGHHHTGEEQAAHGYLAHLGEGATLALLVSFVALLVALSRLTGGLGLRFLPPRAAATIAALAPAGVFAVAEVLERLGSGATPPLALLATGVVVQALIGLVVLAAVRAVVSIAVRLVSTARAVHVPRHLGAPARPGSATPSPRVNPLSTRLAGRAPPRSGPSRAAHPTIQEHHMKRTIQALGLALVASLVTAATASAHVTANPADQEAGSFTKIEFRVPNEQDKATTTVDIQIPEGASFVAVQPVDGWKVEAKTVKLDKPEVAEDGDEVTERTSEVVYSGGRIEPGQFQSFYVSMKLPANGEVGDYLFFPTLQTYEGGEDVSWVQKPKEGADPFSLDSPAPFVKLGAAAAEGDDHAAMADDAVSGSDSGSKDTSDSSGASSADLDKYATDEHVHDHVQKLYVISIAALALAVIALAMALLRRPRRP